jgi:hypothetical protein
LEFFGITFSRKKQKAENVLPSVVTPDLEDGTSVSESAAASYYGYYVDLDGTIKDEIQAIQTYRDISLYPEVDEAIQDIVNEAIPHEEDTDLIELITDKLVEEYSDTIADKITEEFKEVLRLLQFKFKASDIFRRWYVDGRIYYHIVTDKTTKNGIQELRPVDSTKIKKVAEIIKEVKDGVSIVTGVNEYFVYSEKGFTSQSNSVAQQKTTSTVNGIKLTNDSVVYIPSGITEQNTGIVVGHLQKAIRPANQLRMLEDAVVIYRWSRAPERRIFYVDVGNLPKAKAEQYVKDIMSRYRNKLTYDAKTGNIRDDKKYMSMMEDFWMPRRDGGKGTEITTLQGGQNLGELTDVEYFQKKLYQSMNIPVSRVMPENGFSLGRSTEISRDEVKFQKFIGKVRRKFSELIYELLKTQLILKGVINPDEWDEIRELINLRFQRDNFFAELKNAEILNNRVMIATQMEMLLGKYFSVEWVAKNVFMMTEEEIEEMRDVMAQESAAYPWWYQAQQMFEQQQEMQAQQQAQQQQQFASDQDFQQQQLDQQAQQDKNSD